jgi:high affinity Mn2+ porin
VTLWFALFFSNAAWSSPFDSLHLQVTSVSQEHAAFHSPYQGPNSLSPGYDEQTSLTFTVFSGFRLWRGGEFYVNPELAGGSGFSQTRGLAGFPNAEIYRVDDPSPKWNLARLYVRQVIGLDEGEREVKDDKNQIAGRIAGRNLVIVAGKFALNDFFDNNTYSHDPRTQFLNWALMDIAAWDYAADTRGYSWGLMLEYNQPAWSVRWASVQVPVRANQMEMDQDIPARRGDNLEFELREGRSVLRALAYMNYANMGNYRQAIDRGVEVTETRRASVKYGFGLNLERALTDSLGVFARLGWNDGANETWAFTEVDRSLSAGLNLQGASWARPEDSAGLALIVNGLSVEHRDYLAAGHGGFMLGDGRLNYAPEEIAEAYYLIKVAPGLELTLDAAYARNPGYNADRGPVSIGSFRLHAEM